MRMSRTLRSGFLVVTCVLGVETPTPASAQWTVIDPSNLAQNISQVAKSIEQINNQRMQIDYQLQALKKLGNPTWGDIRPLLQQLNQLMQHGQALGYSLANLDQQFRETFPGWQAASTSLSLPGAQRVQAERTLETMRAALNVLNEHARQFAAGQATLASIKAQMPGIEGTQEALELQTTLNAFVADEIGLLRQTVTTQANIQAIYSAYLVNREAEMRANFEVMMDRMTVLPPPSRRDFSLRIQP
ncbi:MAG: P-type conjugative transfer protein TrbJ [Nitriliruptorales bacterium]